MTLTSRGKKNCPKIWTDVSKLGRDELIRKAHYLLNLSSLQQKFIRDLENNDFFALRVMPADELREKCKTIESILDSFYEFADNCNLVKSALVSRHLTTAKPGLYCLARDREVCNLIEWLHRRRFMAETRAEQLFKLLCQLQNMDTTGGVDISSDLTNGTHAKHSLIGYSSEFVEAVRYWKTKPLAALRARIDRFEKMNCLSKALFLHSVYYHLKMNKHKA